MIYVMRSAAFKKGSTTELETIIKIGYTGEKSKKARKSVYLTENPTIQVLYQIEGGTERDEKNLHRYFSNLRVYGKEWFKDEKEILDFFEVHKTKESLREIEKWELSYSKKIQATTNRKANIELSPLINISVSKILDRTASNEQIKTLENYLWYHIEDIWNLLREEFKEYWLSIKEEYDKIEDNRLMELVKEFNKDNNFSRRMKLLCDVYFQYPGFFQAYSNSPLPYIIPINYQNYINAIGFEKIKALNYQEADIKTYIENQQKLSSLSVADLFTVNSKYTKKQIKEMLGEFYNLNNISKTPKATDLENYFIIKAIKLKVGDKWEHGFEIIKKK